MSFDWTEYLDLAHPPVPPRVNGLTGGAKLTDDSGATTSNSTIHAASLRSLTLGGSGLRPFVDGRDVRGHGKRN